MTRSTFGLILLMMLAPAATGFGQTPTFAVKQQEVRLEVLVTMHNKPVLGLTADDFEVFDNGVRQRVNFANEAHTPFNAVLVLDMSMSVAGERLFHLKSAGRQFLDALKTDERAALVTFSNVLSLDTELTDETWDIDERLDSVRPSGRSSVIDASFTGLMVAESRPGRPLVIVFSDGLDTSSWLTEDAVRDTAQSSDAVVYAVSIGRHPRFTFLRDLTQLTGGSLFEIESTKDLDAAFLRILEEFRQRYLVTFSPGTSPKPGWHRLEVRVRDRSPNIKARPGYTVDVTSR